MFKIFLTIFRKKKYAFIATVSAGLITVLSYYLTVFNISHKSILLFIQMNGLMFSVTSLSLGLAISILAGVYVALLIFRRDIIKARAIGNKLASGIGGTAGILAAGCPACSAPFLGLVGLPIGLSSLPFKGLELKVLSIAFLFLSIYLINKNIRKNLTCQIKNKHSII